MSRRRVALCPSLLLLVLAGCDVLDALYGPPRLETPLGDAAPDAVARAWFVAAFAGDAATLLGHTCEAGQNAAMSVVESFSALADSRLDSAVDLSGLTYTTVRDNGDAATVEVGGSIVVTVAGQTVEQPLTGDEPIEMPLVREGGAWKVCGF